MGRRDPAERLGDIVEAGRHLLGTAGYQRTRMADVAAAAGVSAGSVYTYVDSKEALLHAVLTGFFVPSPAPVPELPVTAPPLDETLAAVLTGLARLGATPVLHAALAAEAPDDVASELAAVLDETYSIISRLWPLLAVLEQCARDVPAIHAFYFGGGRHGHLSRFALYVERRVAEGRFRSFGHPGLSAQVAVEAITWHAWHRLEGFDGDRFAEPGSREAVIGFVVGALVAAP